MDSTIATHPETFEELQEWALTLDEKVRDKASTLNHGQLEAVYKIRSFLDRKCNLLWNGKLYSNPEDPFDDDDDEINDLILSEKDPKVQLQMCKEYLIQNAFLLTGGPGFGKTYTSEVAIHGYNFTYCAPTYQACAVLANSTSASKVYTLASALGTAKLDRVTNDQSADDFYLRTIESIRKQSDFGAEPPVIFTKYSFLIDESSMIGGDNKAPKQRTLKEDGTPRTVLLSNDTFVALAIRLLDRIKEYGTLPEKFLFLGDVFQTPPVGTEHDDDAVLLEELMARPDQNFTLREMMRTDKADMKNLLEKYLAEMTRLNKLRLTQGILSADPRSQADLQIIPLQERQNSENIYYYNNAADFVSQFIHLYRNRPAEFQFDPSYVSIVNFNNEVHTRTVQFVNRIRTELFGDPSVKYYEGETLIFKSGYATIDKVTGRLIGFEKDTRVFVESVSAGTMTGRLGKSGPSFAIALPRLTVRSGSKRATFYAASEYFVGVITAIRNGNRYRDRQMHLTSDEMEYFGLRKPFLSYSRWLELAAVVPDFGYAYVVNNFKIQGSSLQYTMVDETNILTSPSSPKKRLQYVYTGLSRGRQKIFIFHSGNKINTKELVLVDKLKT